MYRIVFRIQKRFVIIFLIRNDAKDSVTAFFFCNIEWIYNALDIPALRILKHPDKCPHPDQSPVFSLSAIIYRIIRLSVVIELQQLLPAGVFHKFFPLLLNWYHTCSISYHSVDCIWPQWIKYITGYTMRFLACVFCQIDAERTEWFRICRKNGLDGMPEHLQLFLLIYCPDICIRNSICQRKEKLSCVFDLFGRWII